MPSTSLRQSPSKKRKCDNNNSIAQKNNNFGESSAIASFADATSSNSPTSAFTAVSDHRLPHHLSTPFNNKNNSSSSNNSDAIQQQHHRASFAHVSPPPSHVHPAHHFESSALTPLTPPSSNRDSSIEDEIVDVIGEDPPNASLPLVEDEDSLSGDDESDGGEWLELYFSLFNFWYIFLVLHEVLFSAIVKLIYRVDSN